MGREILFRGKRTDNGKWVYGGIVQSVKETLWCEKDRYFITEIPKYLSSLQLVEAVPETVGQFTGLQDKNGKKIFEGDIVNDGYGKRTVVFGNIGYDSSWNGLTGFGFKEDFNEGFYELCYGNDPLAYAVVGNVYDGLEMSTK